MVGGWWLLAPTLTELTGLLDKHPVAHLLDPKRRRAEEGEGSQGSKRSRK